MQPVFSSKKLATEILWRRIALLKGRFLRNRWPVGEIFAEGENFANLVAGGPSRRFFAGKNPTKKSPFGS